MRYAVAYVLFQTCVYIAFRNTLVVVCCKSANLAIKVDRDIIWKCSLSSHHHFRGKKKQKQKKNNIYFGPTCPLPINSLLQGVYHNDIRDGEGVFTYSGGHQDVGMWKGTKLVQLTSSITDAIFIPRLKHLFNDISGISLPDTKHRNHPKGFLEVTGFHLTSFSYCSYISCS